MTDWADELADQIADDLRGGHSRPTKTELEIVALRLRIAAVSIEHGAYERGLSEGCAIGEKYLIQFAEKMKAQMRDLLTSTSAIIARSLAAGSGSNRSSELESASSTSDDFHRPGGKLEKEVRARSNGEEWKVN